MTYVGAAGRQLIRDDIYNKPNPEFSGQVYVFRNGADSSYNSLQVQYRHRLTSGLQALVSYTWSHSIDDVSSDSYYVNVPPGAEPASLDRGPSNFDIRQTFSGRRLLLHPRPEAGMGEADPGKLVGKHHRVRAQRSPGERGDRKESLSWHFLSGATSVQRPNVVPGVPFYLSDPTAPGGQIINKAAFTVPVSGQGDLSRNALRGFNATQIDFTLQRTFALTERFRLQTSADFFNIFNHPNFGAPINYMTSPQFGFSTQTLNSYLGGGGQSGGLNPLYQIGGPRSIQLALKLQF